jgi:hypothetical protein
VAAAAAKKVMIKYAAGGKGNDGCLQLFSNSVFLNSYYFCILYFDFNLFIPSRSIARVTASEIDITTETTTTTYSVTEYGYCQNNRPMVKLEGIK